MFLFLLFHFRFVLQSPACSANFQISTTTTITASPPPAATTGTPLGQSPPPLPLPLPRPPPPPLIPPCRSPRSPRPRLPPPLLRLTPGGRLSEGEGEDTLEAAEEGSGPLPTIRLEELEGGLLLQHQQLQQQHTSCSPLIPQPVPFPLVPNCSVGEALTLQ